MSDFVPRDKTAAFTPKRAGAGGEFSPLQWTHSILRGRYHWAILLALILGAATAYFRYDQVELEYQATGAVQLRSYTPRLLYSNEMSGNMPNFSAFLDSQVRLVSSDRVADMAMGSDGWRALGREYTPESQEKFRRSLRVRRSGGDIISVSFRDGDREAAQVAVTAVIEAYQRLFNESDPAQERRRMQLLDERRLSLSNQISSLRSQVGAFGDSFGPDGVRFKYQEGVNAIARLGDAIRETELEVAAASQRLETGPPELSIEEIAASNPRVASLLAEMENRRARAALIIDQHGEEHRAYRELKVAIDRLQGMIDREIADKRGTIDIATWERTQQREVERLRNHLDGLRTAQERNSRALAVISADKTRLEALEADMEQAQSRLAEVQRRIETLNVEAAMADRLEVLSYGQAGSRPNNVDEPLREGIIGAAAGSVAGVGLVMLLGLMNPRLRHSADLSVAEGGLRVLGMLPQLPDQLSSPEEAYLAGQCVHQIRMLLQLEGGREDVRSFVVTGPVPGTGKTSLSTALGFSYAAAGAKTLLVDFDLHGAGLTRRMAVSRRKRLGRLLQEDGLVSAADIESAVSSSDRDKPLGQKLIEGNLIGPEDIDRLLRMQESTHAGLLDVLAGEALDHCVVGLSVPNLHLLSVGNATAEHISHVGRSAVKRFLKQVHEAYDVVLIDTGPMPGSIEASLIAAEADRTILTVSRGDQKRKLNDCVAFLNSIGARTAGVVYNRAASSDIGRSVYSASSSRTSVSARSNGKGHGVGPVATAAGGTTRVA
jgi:succinoglycan biosynthesis transport protein ExoP